MNTGPVSRILRQALTVREVARMFEAAGVARTERSIVNWCQPNRSGIARLDAYFDPNERRYFITPQSVELAIAEEKAKTAKSAATSEPLGTISNAPTNTANPRNDSEGALPTSAASPGADSDQIRALERELLDLKITNRGKDYFIEQLKQEREAFADERQEFVDKLMSATRKVGELETRLLQLRPGSTGDVGTA